jgi:hypothetical protein
MVEKSKRRHRRYTPSPLPGDGHGRRTDADIHLQADSEHESRIVAHMRRVERELARMAGVKHYTPESLDDVG